MREGDWLRVRSRYKVSNKIIAPNSKYDCKKFQRVGANRFASSQKLLLKMNAAMTAAHARLRKLSARVAATSPGG